MLTYEDIAQFREQLHMMGEVIQDAIRESKEYPEEVEELLAALERLENELENKNSQQLLSDFALVANFMNAMSEEEYEDDEDDEDEDDEDDDDEYEDEYEEDD